MTTSTAVSNLATRLGTEFKSVRADYNAKIGVLTSLSTADKTSVVAAINELAGAVAGASGIDDTTTGTTTAWSSSKTSTEIGAAIAALVDASPGTLDTLNEIAAALGDDPNFATTITTALGNRVRFDAAQALTEPQQVQARSNIGAASAAAVGDTDRDYVADFEAALV